MVTMFRCTVRSITAIFILLCSPALALAERLCDPAAEDCRAMLLDLIRHEPQGIDVAFWFMEDARYSSELIQRARAGLPVRVLMDSRAPSPVNAQILAQLAAAGIPMRQRTSKGILHWKMMLFVGQRTLEFSGANYSPTAFVPIVPYANYVDEAILFSDDPAIVQSFMRRFDDVWTDTTSYGDYANVIGAPARRYPLYSVDPDLNFPPEQSYRARAVARYRAETLGIDVAMYRITDRAHADAMIDAVRRGVPVRLITEPAEYRDPTRLWHSWNVDRLYMAGVQIRDRAHEGLTHQKSVLLRGQDMVIFGSSNWTSPSSDSQEEHNYFATKPSITTWFRQQFERKWNNLAGPETKPFQPLPPDVPIYVAPAPGASDISTTTSLVFTAGPFAHLYDIYFGTVPDPPLVEHDIELGPTVPGGIPRRYALPDLQPNTVYYWRVVARTMARQESGQVVSSFVTGSPSPASGPPVPEPPPQCLSVMPAPGWLCIRGGWVPPDSPLATGGGAVPTGAPPPGPPPPSGPGSCSSVQPAPSWVCVDGGWLPPDHPLARAAGTGTPPAPAPPPTSSPPPGSCLTAAPGPGWVCVGGGWVPPDHPLARPRGAGG
jgi:hypothetical protein